MDLTENTAAAAQRIREVRDAGGGLFIFTGAGMSVMSGVPVFRNSDGSMSEDFLRFLGDYNTARQKHGLSPAPDWFDFSVAEMFRKETEKEAWQYWRWRVLRSLVAPAEDYELLNKIAQFFENDRVFAQTSNCDGLHVKAGLSPDQVEEIHGSLSRVQCSGPCSDELYPVDDDFVQHLREDPNWVPRCPNCNKCCLRPNVMIFKDTALVHSRLDEESNNFDVFEKNIASQSKGPRKAGPHSWVVLEIGAGTVVPSIRYNGERYGFAGRGLIRVNPSRDECAELQSGTNFSDTDNDSAYFPLVARSDVGLRALVQQLGLDGDESS